MMQIVFDTDILSVFAKADAIRYIESLFPRDKLLITPDVYSECTCLANYKIAAKYIRNHEITQIFTRFLC